MKDITVNLGNVKLKSPLIIGANDGLQDFNMFSRVAETTQNLGAFVTKSFTSNERLGNKDPIVARLGNNVLVSSGIRNPGSKVMLSDIAKYNKNYNAPLLIPSIADDPDNTSIAPEKDLATLALKLYDQGSSVIEFNLSCPNLNKHDIVANQPGMIELILHHIKNEFEKRNLTNYFLIAKLAGNDASLVNIAKQAQLAGADAITVLPLLRATGFYTGLIKNQLEQQIQEPLLGNIHGTVYGEGLGPLTRQLVVDLKEIIDIPIIASGGCLGGVNSSILEKTDGLIQTMMAGANAIEVVSSFYPFSIDKLMEVDVILDKYKNYINTHDIQVNHA